MRSRFIPLRSWLRPLVTAFVAVSTFAGAADAQPVAPGAVLRITVLDQTGAPLSGAQVTLRDPSGIERTVAVNASGASIFDALTPATYQFTASA